ncbi:acyloxyacyl hydrolase [Carboxylicivirga sp. N1Y90]|uniref:acyloxyacyl hydrolase n=1 Tax=Carboxylicivirga fragile TaxID=3417571 RepID=UPI003D3519A2|nr:acyloxyacyl hydrolase [Marinilabiliaceae bacterium N1Y90]
MKNLLVAILLIIGFGSQAQSSKKDSTKTKPKKNNSVAVRYHWGTVLQTNDFLKGENNAGKPIDFYHALNLSYGVQTDGSKDWHHIFNFPSYGVSWYNADFFNTDELGNPTAIYGFMSFPFRHTEKSTWGYELGFGLTYNWQPYDKYSNPFNTAIGSNRTVFIDANLFYKYHLGNRWDLRGSFGFTHFSNGGTKKPNSGINLLSPSIELSYNFKDRPLLIREIKPAYEQHYEVALQIGAGARNILYDNPNGEDPNQGTADVMHSYVNISGAFLKATTWKHKFGGGIDFTYDETANVQVTNPANGNEEPIVNISDKFSEKFMLGIFGTYEYTIDRLSVASYLGYLVYRKEVTNESNKLYQKFGIKYHFKNDMYAGLLVRAHNFSVAEVIEWNLGYRIKWN